MIPEQYYHSDIGEYYTYGIKVIGADYSEALHDVSVCRELVEGMVDVFNQYQVSPVHLHDVVEDLLP